MPVHEPGVAARTRTALFARPTSLADRLGQGGDNVLLLRHIAAALVIVGHSYALSAHAGDARDVLAMLLPGFYAGSVAVCAFFAISGCLITHSWMRNPHLWRFVKARLLRIYPAYAVCLLLTVGIVGALFTSLPALEYFSHDRTRDYVMRNADLAGLAYALPGVFMGNRAPEIVNGSLWSLALEVRTYLVLTVLAALGVLGKPRLFGALVLAYAGACAWDWIQAPPQHQDKGALTLLFMTTALATTFARHAPLSTRVLVALAALTWVLRGNPWFVAATMLTIGYFCLWFCWRLPPWKLPWRGDYSYGLFLYGFPVQQMLVALYPVLDPVALTACALPLTLLVAIASWRWVEQPLLGLKQSRSLSRTSIP